jgi:hypothetical protein
MPNARIIDIVERSQDEATGYKPADEGSDGSNRVDLLVGLAKAGQQLPPWWSTSRDRELSRFWKESNHLSLAVYNAQSKLVSLPFEVVARDQTNDMHVLQANELTFLLTSGTQFGETWGSAYARFVEDLLTQDNGGFMEIIGGGNPDGPIVGMPTSVRHLDSQRCTRRADPIYPVRYYAEDGKRYLIHWTRVVYLSQMPSARTDMNGVGLCAVSRVADVAQNLMDILYYKQERLGSRPPNSLIVGKGVTGRQIMEAFYTAAQEASNAGSSRYSKTVAIGSENPDIEIDLIDLNHMEPFDEETSLNLGMYAIASAFGMDVQELWPTLTGGSSGDASLRRSRSRGKFPAQTTAAVEAQFNYKVMPPHLKLRFDFKDDEEDQQRASIRDIRGRNRQREISSGTVNVATARQFMHDDGDLDRVLLENMELEDGRLGDGSPVGILFYEDDPVYKRHLSFSFDVLVFNDNDPEAALTEIQKAKTGVLQEWAVTTSASKKDKLRLANGALTWAEKKYEKLLIQPEPDSPNGEPPKQEATGQQVTSGDIAARAPKKPRDGRNDG